MTQIVYNLQSLFSTQPSMIGHVSLTQKVIDESNFEEFLEALKKCRDIHTIDVSNNNLTEEQIRRICKILPTLPNLKKLVMYGMYLDSDLLEIIDEAIKTHGTIKEFVCDKRPGVISAPVVTSYDESKVISFKLNLLSMEDAADRTRMQAPKLFVALLRYLAMYRGTHSLTYLPGTSQYNLTLNLELLTALLRGLETYSGTHSLTDSPGTSQYNLTLNLELYIAFHFRMVAMYRGTHSLTYSPGPSQ